MPVGILQEECPSAISVIDENYFDLVIEFIENKNDLIPNSVNSFYVEF